MLRASDGYIGLQAGVFLHSTVLLYSQIALVEKTTHFHLQLTRRLHPVLLDTDLATVIHLFVMSRFDYCNSCTSRNETHLLQQSASWDKHTVAHLLSNKGCCEPITPVLHFLGWFPIQSQNPVQGFCPVRQSLPWDTRGTTLLSLS